MKKPNLLELEKAKMILAIVMIVIYVGSSFLFGILGFYGDGLVFIIFAIATFWYIRLLRSESKQESWYKKDMEDHE